MSCQADFLWTASILAAPLIVDLLLQSVAHFKPLLQGSLLQGVAVLEIGGV
jgi:hypothetical protein